MEDSDKNIYDMVVIGGGPIGMFAAYYAGLRTLKVQLIESLGQLGGQLEALYPEKEMINVPGFNQIKATDFISRLIRQLNEFPVNLLLNNTVKNIVNNNGIFEIQTDKVISYAKTIIIATGIGTFEPRKLPFFIDPEFEKKFISYYVKNPRAYQGLSIAITGGGDGAIDTALELINYAKQITIIHRRDAFRALESNMVKIENSNAKLLTPFTIYKLEENPKSKDRRLKIFLNKVREPENKSTIDVDRLIVNFGFKANNRIQQSWGLNLDRNLITVNSKMESNRKGIFAIGDAAIYPNKQKILANGFGEVPIAVNCAIEDFSLTRNRNIHGVVQ